MTEKNTPKNGADENIIWLLVAPIFWDETIYSTMLAP